MLDLAISIDTDSRGTTVIETNHGIELKAPSWPSDCDCQLVVFSPSRKLCEIVYAEELAEDIAMALVTLDRAAALKGTKPDWYRRLKDCARGITRPGK
jgi:hypothetical protein